jgi:hypothetical protein
MRWRPFLAAAAGVLAVVVALGAADAPAATEPLVLVLVAMLVGSAALALDDPAHSLVAAAPVGFTRRLAHRVAWIGPALIGCSCSIGWIALRLDAIPSTADVLAWCAALGSVALVTHLLVARTRPELAAPAAAATPAGWVVVLVSTSGGGSFASAVQRSLDRPWAIAGCAAVIFVIASRRA